MSKFYLHISKILIYIISIYRSCINNVITLFSCGVVEHPNVLITFAGAIGDGVCFLDALDALNKIYSKEKEGNVTFAIKPSVYTLYQSIGIVGQYNFIIIDFHKYCMDIDYFLSTNRTLKKRYDIVITPQKAISAAMVTCNVRSCKKMTIDYNLDFHYGIPKSILYKCAYNERFIIEPFCSYIKAVNILVNRLSANFYSCVIPQIKINAEYLMKHDSKYVVLAPFSSRSEKEWNVVNYIPTANYLIKKGYSIYVIGDRDRTDTVKKFILGIDDVTKVVDLCGKTSVKEWIDLVFLSSICIGADSATIHLAATLNIPAFCVVGRMDYGLIFPYMIDEIKENQYIPVTIFSDEMDCQGCRTKTENYGSGNIKCEKRIKSGEAIQCINVISSDKLLIRVMKLIN